MRVEMTDWVLLDRSPNVEVLPDYQVDKGVSVRLIPADPAHRTEIEGTVYPYVEINYCVTVPQYRQEQEQEGTTSDSYRYAVEEQAVIARDESDMDYQYEYPDAFDYETVDEAIRARDVFAKRAENPTYIAWRPWATTEPEASPVTYVAGWNMPGYMPDSEPAEFETFEDAREYLASEIEYHASSLDWDADDEDGRPLIDLAKSRADEVRRWSGPDDTWVEGDGPTYVYWIQEEVVGCSCGQADYGTPGHDGGGEGA